MSDCSPLDVRLHVFDGQNYVSEANYRAKHELAEGFRLERNIEQEIAMKAQAMLDIRSIEVANLEKLRDAELAEAQAEGRRQGANEWFRIAKLYREVHTETCRCSMCLRYNAALLESPNTSPAPQEEN
jgi:hypothetical protein